MISGKRRDSDDEGMKAGALSLTSEMVMCTRLVPYAGGEPERAWISRSRLEQDSWSSGRAVRMVPEALSTVKKPSGSPEEIE